MKRINAYLKDVEENASEMTSNGRITYMYYMIDNIYQGAKKSGLTPEDEQIIGHFRDETLKYAEPRESHLSNKDLEELN